MRILIIGTGTIGKPLIRLFLRKKDDLGIKEVIFHKNEPELKCRGMLKRFHFYGAKLAVYQERMQEFKKLLASDPLNFEPEYTFEEALSRADVVIDCTNKGNKMKENYYQHLKHHPIGFIAQGSEKGFGKPYAFDINDRALVIDEDQFIQVVSCNVHNGLRLLKTVAFDPDHRGFFSTNNLVRARFYIARRGADISQDEFTIGPQIGKPTHPVFGTHQGEDMANVLETIGLANLNLHTTADVFNQPYMHVYCFDITLAEKVSIIEIENRFRYDPLVAVTYEERANRVFAIGRDEGHFGRILNQTVVCLPSLEVISNGYEVVGRCLTPQDGNALLSSVAAALWFKYPDTYKQIVREHFFKLPFLFDEV